MPLNILNISIDDFLNHNKSYIDCTQFNSILIIGKDKNNPNISNATGKSSFLWAIAYAFWNEHPAKTIDKIVRDGHDKCEVSIEFEVNNKIYKITRKRSNKSNKSEVRLYEFINNEWNKQDGLSNPETEIEIQKLIKINYKTFKNTIWFKQDSLIELISATSSSRKNLLKEPLNLYAYSVLEKNAKTKLSKVEFEYNLLKSNISSIGNPQEDIVKFDNDLLNLNNQLNILNSSREENQKELDGKRLELSDLKRALSSENFDISSQLSDTLSKIKICENAVSRLENNLNLENNKLSIKLNYIPKLNNEVKSLSIQLSTLKSQLTKSEEDLKNEIISLKRKENDGVKYITQLELEFKKYSKPLPAEAECELCFHEISDNYREKVSEEHFQKASDLKKQIENYSKKLLKCRTLIKTLEKELDDYRNTNKSIEIINSKIENKTIELRNQNDLVKEINDNIVNIQQSLVECNSEKLSLIERKNTLENYIKKLNIEEINNKILSIESLIKFKEKEINLIISNFSSTSTMIGVIEEKRKNREDDISKLDQLNFSKINLEKNIKTHNKVIKAFSASGIPTLIINTILDDLQLETNKILQEMRPDLELIFQIDEQKDTLDIVYKVNGKNRDFDVLSGGQRSYIAVSLRLGLSAIIQKRLGVDIRFLLLDEVDYPFDKAGEDDFFNILKKLQEKFKLFVISHRESIKDKFSSAILIENDGTSGATASIISNW